MMPPGVVIVTKIITDEVRGSFVYIALLLLLVQSAVVPRPTPFRRCVPSQSTARSCLRAKGTYCAGMCSPSTNSDLSVYRRKKAAVLRIIADSFLEDV